MTHATCRTSIAILATLIVAACSSAEEETTTPSTSTPSSTTTTTDTGTGGGGAGGPGGGGGSGASGGSGGAGIPVDCDDDVVLPEFGVDTEWEGPLASAPSPEGGAVEDGLYYLSTSERYSDNEGSTPMQARWSLEFTADQFVFRGTSVTVPLSVFGGYVDFVDNQATFATTWNCPDGGGLGLYETPYGYTATSAAFTMFYTNPTGSLIVVNTWNAM